MFRFFEWHLHSREDLEAGRVDREYTARERDFIAERLVEGVGRLGIFYGARAAPGMKTRTVDLEDVTTYYRLVLERNSYHPEIPIATETYYIVNGSLTRPRLDYVLDNVAERLPFFGVLTWLPPNQALPGDKRLSETFLTDLARSADLIVVGAYGGDANLIWTRGN